jgi:nucleoside 2-deoxyribosyltransferase
MNIYFSCSITGGRREQSSYRTIVDALLADGHTVPTAVLADANILDFETAIAPTEIYERDMDWIDRCDVVVAEISTPSHGVGYEIAYALMINKPVLCGYEAGKPVSKMLTGNTHPNITIIEYGDVGDFVAQMKQYLRDKK